jgi:hypothetical protein
MPGWAWIAIGFLGALAGAVALVLKGLTEDVPPQNDPPTSQIGEYE